MVHVKRSKLEAAILGDKISLFIWDYKRCQVPRTMKFLHFSLPRLLYAACNIGRPGAVTNAY